MSKIDATLRNDFGREVLKKCVDNFTRVDYEGPDYILDISLNEGKWMFVVTPKTDYGELAMKKIFEVHATEELSKG